MRNGRSVRPNGRSASSGDRDVTTTGAAPLSGATPVVGVGSTDRSDVDRLDLVLRQRRSTLRGGADAEAARLIAAGGLAGLEGTAIAVVAAWRVRAVGR